MLLMNKGICAGVNSLHLQGRIGHCPESVASSCQWTVDSGKYSGDMISIQYLTLHDQAYV